jgi:hypothetical protein
MILYDSRLLYKHISRFSLGCCIRENTLAIPAVEVLLVEIVEASHDEQEYLSSSGEWVKGRRLMSDGSPG